MTYLLSRTNPAGGPISRSQYTQLTTRGPDRGMVREIHINPHFFFLKFCTHVIYTYINWFLCLQTNRACIACPVESEYLPIERWQRSWEPLDPRLTFHWARDTCPVDLKT